MGEKQFHKVILWPAHESFDTHTHSKTHTPTHTLTYTHTYGTSLFFTYLTHRYPGDHSLSCENGNLPRSLLRRASSQLSDGTGTAGELACTGGRP